MSLIVQWFLNRIGCTSFMWNRARAITDPAVMPRKIYIEIRQLVTQVLLKSSGATQQCASVWESSSWIKYTDTTGQYLLTDVKKDIFPKGIITILWQFFRCWSKVLAPQNNALLSRNPIVESKILTLLTWQFYQKDVKKDIMSRRGSQYFELWQFLPFLAAYIKNRKNS